jgi:hypothetical protein
MVSSSQVSSWFGQGIGNLSNPSRLSPVATEYLVVGAGGGGSGGQGGAFSGSGGAGGIVLTGTLTLQPGLSYLASIGVGGMGTAVGNAGAGSSSIFNTVTATGGGGSVTTTRNGADNALFVGGTAGSGGNGMGGAGAGGNGSGTTGGIGVFSSITGSSVGYGGGAGGTGVAGTSGGGTGVNGVGTSGTANRGGGGGGGYNNNPNGSGGSGVVILKYPEIFTVTIGSGLTGSTAGPSGGFKVTTITAGTGTVSFA